VNNPGCFLHNAIAAFHKKAPEVRMAIHVASPSEVERMVLEGTCGLGFGACGQHSPYLVYEDLFEERQVLYCGRGHPLFDPVREVTVTDLKDMEYVRRAYAAPEKLPGGIRISQTAVADLMESVAAFILSGHYIGFLPTVFSRPWVEQGMMRPILETTLGYQNPVYLVTRKTEEKRPALALFLKELRRAHEKPLPAGSARPAPVSETAPG
jgi:LysR family transcriptional regulator, transcriptional activator for bauABCD operon